MDSFSFDDGKAFKTSKDEPWFVVFDTGMSFAMIPKEDFFVLFKHLN